MTQRDQMETRRYYKKLMDMNFHFNLERALELSDEIHEAEAVGYELTSGEDVLWARLTERIEKAKPRSRATR